jgi:hypothetical protein
VLGVAVVLKSPTLEALCDALEPLWVHVEANNGPHCGVWARAGEAVRWPRRAGWWKTLPS